LNASTPRTFTFARVVALLLIAVVAVGLAYLRFGTGDDPVSVRGGAKAGDLTLEPCDYATESGSYAADCGTLVVPENRADPGTRLIALPVTRIRALADRPREPIFRLQGGPGISNMQFSEASRFADNHDVVLVGYRGVEGSVRLDCSEVSSALKRSGDILGEKSARAFSEAMGSCATRLTDEGVDLAGYTLPQRVDDLEAARRALGYGRVDLVSESVGTRTAMIYAWRYPRSIHRSVMIAANPPGGFLWDAKTTDEQIGRYANVCAKDDRCSERTDDLAASMRRTAADIPDHWFFLPIRQGNVRVASFYGLMETTEENAPLMAPMTLSSWLAASEGDASGFWFLSLLADLAFPEAFVWGEYAATAMADARAARSYFAGGPEPGSNLGRAATAFGWGGGRLVDTWPEAPDAGRYSHVRTSQVETLLIGGALDFAVPPQLATRKLLPHLPNGHQVVLPGFGHSLDFWTYQQTAGTRLITAFLDCGVVDDSRYVRQAVDFSPEVTQPALAKGFAGTMAGLAILTVLSLLVMALRVRMRGRIGRTSGALLRSVYSVVLGLGGWFLAILVATTTAPGVALDDVRLAVLSIGLPIGLGIYLAWVDRNRPAGTRALGLAGAIAGAAAGGWLGFHATVGLAAVITTIVGATAGANLVLIVLDIVRGRPIARPVAEPRARDIRAVEL
jgi:pimeloyl-ACP methyl ester carboxylesterase